MKLRYQITVDDLAAFTRYFHEHAPTFRRQCHFVAAFVFVVVFVVVLGIFMYIVTGVFPAGEQPRTPSFAAATLASGIALSLGCATCACLLWRPVVLNRIEQNARKLFLQNPDKLALGEQELELTDGWLTDRHNYGESRLRLDILEDVAATPRHVFLRISAMRAYVLPRDQIDEVQLEQFLDELERQQHQPTAQQPSSARPPSEPSEAIRAIPPAGGR
jgi:YcxB-like protein